MATCKICGYDRCVHYRDRSRMMLCASCHETTPAKVSLGDFCRNYFDKKPDDMTDAEMSTASEFYDDYRTSTYGSVAEYRAATTEPC